MTEAQKMGVWGTMSGGVALASFGYKMTQGTMSADSTPMQRWGAARDLISFTSALGSHGLKTLATVLDLCSGANDKYVWNALGLDQTLPQLYGRQSFLPGEVTWSQMWSGYDITLTTEMPFAGLNQPDFEMAVGKFDNIFKASTVLDATCLARVGGTVLKLISPLNDLAGVADIVTGAIGLKDAIQSNDAAGKVNSSLEIVGGSFSAAGGSISAAGLFATVPTAFAAAAAPLLWAGAVVGVAALIVAQGIGIAQRINQERQAVDEQNNWFDQLAGDGLLESDVLIKLEFLRKSFVYYDNDNTDPSKSYFEFQSAEWENFKNTGSLDERLHIETPLTKLNPWDIHPFGMGLV